MASAQSSHDMWRGRDSQPPSADLDDVCGDLPDFGQNDLPDFGQRDLPDFGQRDLPVALHRSGSRSCGDLPDFGQRDLPVALHRSGGRRPRITTEDSIVVPNDRRRTVKTTPHERDRCPGVLHEGDSVQVFSKSADEWANGKIVKLVGKNFVHVEYHVGEDCHIKVLNVRSKQLILPFNISDSDTSSIVQVSNARAPPQESLPAPPQESLLQVIKESKPDNVRRALEMRADILQEDKHGLQPMDWAVITLIRRMHEPGKVTQAVEVLQWLLHKKEVCAWRDINRDLHKIKACNGQSVTEGVWNNIRAYLEDNSPQWFCDSGYTTAQKFREVGFTAQQLRKAGYTASDAGFTAKELVDADYMAKDLVVAGFTVNQLVKAKFSAEDLKTAWEACDKELYKLADDLADAGHSAKHLRDAGFSGADLTSRPNWTDSRRRRGGCKFTGKELRTAGFQPKDLLGVRCSLFTHGDGLIEAGFTSHHDWGLPGQFENAMKQHNGAFLWG